MATRLRNLLRSPLFLVLGSHLASALGTGATLVLHGYDRGLVATPGTTLPTLIKPGSLHIAALGNSAVFMIWAMLGWLIVPAATSLLIALAFGRWGLPGHRQGRAVLCVPVLSAFYLILGAAAMFIFFAGFESGLRQTFYFFVSDSGVIMILVYYVALSTIAVGLPWAVALTITHYMRSSGRWETIGY